MKKIVSKITGAVGNRIMNLADAVIDRKICGRSLVKYVPSIYRDNEKGIGGTGSQSTHYSILKRIFSHVTLGPEDVFLDIGCGKGRVLASLIREKSPCQIFGIEHNGDVGAMAADWAERYENVHVIVGDAFDLDYDPYTVLFLARPFLPKTFAAFLEQLEGTLKHPVTLIYWCDQESGHLLKNRPGWNRLFREKLAWIHGLRIAWWPQYYSIWTYDPEQRGNIQAEHTAE